MLEAILLTLKTMGWLGIILGILVCVNVVTCTLDNVWSGKESFSWSKMLRGIGKSAVFYVCAVFISVAFTMLPFINTMITNAFGVMLLSEELLSTLSGIGVLGTVVSVIVVQGKKAIEGVVRLANVSTNTEEIT